MITISRRAKKEFNRLIKFLTFLGLALPIIFIACINQTHAAEIISECDKNFCRITIKGDIIEGDASKFRNTVSDLNRKKNVVHVVRLFSRGGNLTEGIDIGRQLREALILSEAPRMETYYPKNIMSSKSIEAARRTCREECFSYFVEYHNEGSLTNSKRAVELGLESVYRKKLAYDQDIICASACALIALGSPERVGTAGLHHIYAKDASSSYEEFDTLLKDGLGSVADYFREMRAPADIQEKISSTPSNELLWINLSANYRFDPVFYEYLISHCDSLTSDEQQTQSNLLVSDFTGSYYDFTTNELVEKRLTKAEKSYLETLNAKSAEFEACKMKMTIAAQTRAQLE